MKPHEPLSKRWYTWREISRWLTMANVFVFINTFLVGCGNWNFIEPYASIAAGTFFSSMIFFFVFLIIDQEIEYDLEEQEAAKKRLENWKKGVP